MNEPIDVIPLVAEELVVGRRITTHRIDVSTIVEEHDEIVSTTSTRARIDVRHVPINREIAEVPQTRTDNGVLIVPVYEERVKLVKHLFLVEELHLHQVQEEERIEQPIKLRTMRAIVDQDQDQQEEH